MKSNIIDVKDVKHVDINFDKIAKFAKIGSVIKAFILLY